MISKKVLLVGSSFSAVAIFFVLKNNNMHVSVCGNNKNDPCHQYADKSYFIDYSNKEALTSLIAQEKFDYIVPSCNDYAYMSCAWVAEKFGYVGFDDYKVASIIHNKSLFRAFLQQHLLPAPQFFQVTENQSNIPITLNYPLLVKPVDSFSGRGVTKVSNHVELAVAIENALKTSRSTEAIVEEFVQGDLHSHSSFIQDGHIVFDVFADEFCTVYPYQVNCSNHPSRLPELVQQRVRDSIEQLIGLLNLSDGLLHTQFIVKDNQFWLIECMRRCPGDLYGDMIELSTGIDYVEMYTHPFINKKNLAINSLGKIKSIGRHTISVTKPLVSFSFSCQIPSKTIQIVPLKSSGELLNVAPYDKLAIFFVEYQDKQQMHKITPQLDQFVSIQSHKARQF